MIPYHQKLTLASQVNYCAPDPPAAPDPKEQAGAQTGANISTATANAALQNINEYTPTNSVVRKQTGTQSIWDENLKKNITVPTYSTYQTYSPSEQAVYESNTANRLGVNAVAGNLINNVGKSVSTPIDYSKLPAAGSTANITAPKYTNFAAGPKLKTDLAGADDFSADRAKVEGALMARMNPQLQQDKNTLEQQLLNQGLQPGSEAYNRAVDQSSRAANDARYGAILAGGQEQSRLFAQDLAAKGFYNTATQGMADNAYRTTAANNQNQTANFNAQTSLFGLNNIERQNALKEKTDAINLPIQQITALMGHGNIQQTPYAGANMPTLPTVDYAGLMQQNYANQQANYQQESANYNNMVSGAGNLFSNIIASSDIRLKENIEPLGRVGGHNVYAFDYRDAVDGVGRQVGVMAQEVMQTRPDAVLRRADGMLMVDYGKLFGGQNS
jgi:hypothetical protein